MVEKNINKCRWCESLCNYKQEVGGHTGKHHRPSYKTDIVEDKNIQKTTLTIKTLNNLMEKKEVKLINGYWGRGNWITWYSSGYHGQLQQFIRKDSHKPNK